MPVLCMLPTQDKEDNHSFFTHRAFVVLTVVNISKAVYVLKDNADGVDGLQQSLVVSILPKKSKPSKDQRSQSASLSRKEFVKYSERLERSCTGALHDVFAAEPAPSFSFAPPSPEPPPLSRRHTQRADPSHSCPSQQPEPASSHSCPLCPFSSHHLRRLGAERGKGNGGKPSRSLTLMRQPSL